MPNPVCVCILDIYDLQTSVCPLRWDSRIYQMLLYRGIRPRPMSVQIYDTKQCNGKFQIMLELWGMRSTSSLSSLAGLLWCGVVAPDRVIYMSQTELNCVLILN